MRNNDCTVNTNGSNSEPKLSPANLGALRNNPPLFLSRAEAALVACVSLRTIADLIARRKLKVVRIGDRRIVKRTDLEAFMDRQTA